MASGDKDGVVKSAESERSPIPVQPPRRRARAFFVLRNMLTVDRAFWRRRFWASYRLAQVAQRRGAVQKLAEFAPLLALLARRPPTVVVEIGTHHGGSFYALCKVAGPRAILISIDLPGGLFGGGYNDEELSAMRGYGSRSQSLHFLACDSQRLSTREAVVKLLNGRGVDFLLIDGDHRYDGVRRDFELYSPLVGDGGLIAFHDILPHPQVPLCQVDIFWNEVKGRCRHLELVDPSEDWGNGQWGGIGVLFWHLP
jgi:predicted O-methyltransferase YrrM